MRPRHKIAMVCAALEMSARSLGSVSPVLGPTLEMATAPCGQPGARGTKSWQEGCRGRNPWNNLEQLSGRGTNVRNKIEQPWFRWFRVRHPLFLAVEQNVRNNLEQLCVDVRNNLEQLSFRGTTSAVVCDLVEQLWVAGCGLLLELENHFAGSAILRSS